ncbi:MAG TPA: hypothetical protein VGD75_20950, partial [Bradyrhizobium sp.]
MENTENIDVLPDNSTGDPASSDALGVNDAATSEKRVSPLTHPSSRPVPEQSDAPSHRQKNIGHVYFIGDGEHIKIGFSKWPPFRLRDLQIGNPKKLELLGTIPGS